MLEESSAEIESPPHLPGRAEPWCRDSGSEFANTSALQKLLQGKQRRQRPAPGGSLSPSYLAAVCLSLCKCHCSCPSPPGCCITCVGFAVCLGGLKKAGGKKEAAKASPLQELPVQDSSCSRSASVLGSACLPHGVRRADCLFLCSR